MDRFNSNPQEPGHGVGAWYCDDCDTLLSVAGVVPSIDVVPGPDGEPTPVITLRAADGHRQVVTLGWANLDIIGRQVLVAQAQDPDRGPALLAGMPLDQRVAVLRAVLLGREDGP